MSEEQPISLVQRILDFQIYYNVFYRFYGATVAAPFILAIAIFYIVYAIKYRATSTRTRTKKMIDLQTRVLKIIALYFLFFSIVPIVCHGYFWNEFVRISLIWTTLVFTYFARIHWLNRNCAFVFNFFMIFIEVCYLRELLLQLACADIGQCKGGSSFDELSFLKTVHLNNGSVLVEGQIPYPWASIFFWRAFLAIFMHYQAILVLASMSLKLGIFSQAHLDIVHDEVISRPPEDTTTMFSFVRQAFYHKTLAYTNHEKESKNTKRKCC